MSAFWFTCYCSFSASLFNGLSAPTNYPMMFRPLLFKKYLGRFSLLLIYCKYKTKITNRHLRSVGRGVKVTAMNGHHSPTEGERSFTSLRLPGVVFSKQVIFLINLAYWNIWQDDLAFATFQMKKEMWSVYSEYRQIKDTRQGLWRSFWIF